MPTYECDCCGACCRGHLIVEVYEIDLWRQPALVDADVRRGPESPEEIMADLEQEGSCLVIAGGENNPCFFLGEDCRCWIYPTRPNVCVAMQAGDPQCQMALDAAGLPPLQPAADGHR